MSDKIYRNLHGWQTPDGQFLSMPLGWNHGDYASNKLDTDNFHDLFLEGYMRITYIGNDLMVNNPFKLPCRKQVKELIDAAIENELETIIYDNDKDEQLLWKKNTF